MAWIHALIALLLLSGCAPARVSRSVTGDSPGDDMDAQLDFWHTLATKPVCCNDDAMHGLLLDLDGTDPSTTYADRIANLKKRGLVLGGFDGPADEAVSRGTVAVALCKAADIHGGVILTVTGMSERYALRELQFRNLLPPSSVNQTFSGLEFVGVIGRFEDYQRGNPADIPASVMPQPTSFRGNPAPR